VLRIVKAPAEFAEPAVDALSTHWSGFRIGRFSVSVGKPSRRPRAAHFVLDRDARNLLLIVAK